MVSEPNNKINRPKTIFSDIDGVIFKHEGDISNQHLITPTVLPGVLKNFQEWDRRGYRIILTTGRRESTRPYTEKQLAMAGIFYDQLIMGITGGVRILINDRKPGSEEDTAVAINLVRNEGQEEIL